MRPTMTLAVSMLALAAVFGGCSEQHPELPPLPAIEVTTDDPQISEQVAEARARLEKDPYDAQANGELGALYELYQRPEGARICYRRAALLAPEELRWTYHLGRAERNWGEAAAAREALERAVAIDGQYLPAIALLGELELEEGNFERAEELFRQILSAAPNSCSGLLGLGRIEAERGDHAAASEHYTQALAVAPGHGPLHYAAGISRRALGETDLAERHLAIARVAGNANPDPDPLLEEVRQLERGSERDYREATRVLGQNRPAEAIPLLRKVVEADPERIAAQGYLAKALMMVGDPSALGEYERALELNPTNIDFLRPYALLLYRAGRHEEAERSMREVMRLGGDHSDDHHILGISLLKQGRLEEAEREFEATLERKPDHEEARLALEMIRKRRNSG